MHKYYHNNFSANKQNRDAQTREQGGSAVLFSVWVCNKRGKKI
jgi:hypothetical protein